MHAHGLEFAASEKHSNHKVLLIMIAGFNGCDRYGFNRESAPSQNHRMTLIKLYDLPGYICTCILADYKNNLIFYHPGSNKPKYSLTEYLVSAKNVSIALKMFNIAPL